jgi:ABC-type uncharacterized transport system permease subunit
MSLVTSRWTTQSSIATRWTYGFFELPGIFELSIYYRGIKAFADIIIPITNNQSGKRKKALG